MIDFGVKETTSTGGTGTIARTQATDLVRFSQAFSLGDDVAPGAEMTVAAK